MIELIFTACLMIAPQSCEERSQLLMPEIGLNGCMLTAQPQLARWSEAHPAYRIARWSCRPADRPEIRA